MHYRHAELDAQFLTPRTYQIELLDKAKKENLIIPLGTGTGKTFIAVMLIREMAADVRVPVADGGKRSFFLCNTVPLVNQQAEHIRKFSDLTVGEFHGRMNVDVWEKSEWQAHIEENQVLVMTAQIFCNLLHHGYWRLERCNLVVFDECHHARKDHPYRQIMRHYADIGDDEKPRILGLTASVISENILPLQLEENIKMLEQTLSSRVDTASDLGILTKYGAKPEQIIVACEDYEDTTLLSDDVENLLQKAINFVKASNFHKELDLEPDKAPYEALWRTRSVLKQLGPWAAWKVAGEQDKLLQKLSKFVMTPFQESFILLGRTYLRAVRRMLHRTMTKVRSVEDLVRVSPAKFRRLLEILFSSKPVPKPGSSLVPPVPRSERRPPRTGGRAYPRNPHFHNPDENFSGLVFVQERYVAFILTVMLKNVKLWDQEKYGFLRVDYVIGSTGYRVPSEDQQAQHSRQEEVLRNFRQKTLNLLVATSVLEEGVDVRQCNCVVRYDLPSDFVSYVQSKGRARKAGSMYFMLVEESKLEKFNASFKNYLAIEATLSRHYRNRHNPEAREIEAQFADQLLEPYYPPIPEGVAMEGRPRVTMTSAIALVNRYCARLPSDIFTRLTAHSDIHATARGKSPMYQAKMFLPINSPVKEEIMGVAMPNKKFAQMATALECCKVLHQRGELDDHLLPIGKESLRLEMAALEDDDDDDAWPADGKARPGSTKRRQYYDKKLADSLSDAFPAPGAPVYIHLLRLMMRNPAEGADNPKNRKIMDPSYSDRCFGFLSRKKIPPAPLFPLFTRQGEVMVEVHTLPETTTVTQDNLNSLATFHHYVFSDLLRLEKFSMRFQPSKAKNAIFIAPLMTESESVNGYVVDWKFITEIVSVIDVLPRPPTQEQREAFTFKPENYEDAIVLPWYRNVDQPHFYYVAEILYDQSPEHQFPDEDFGSFNDYFMTKYSLKIYCKDQPLLDVDYTSNRLNLLTPRHVSRRATKSMSGATASGNAACTLTQKQILVPELVDIHPISASLWNMIICLPSTIYRLNNLLIADEFRIKIETEAFGKTIPEDSTDELVKGWEPLGFGWRTEMPDSEDATGGHGPSATECSRSDSEGSSAGAVGNTGSAAIQNSDPIGKSNSEPKTGGNRKKKIEPDPMNDSFEIGIWDPCLAENLAPDPISLNGVDPPTPLGGANALNLGAVGGMPILDSPGFSGFGGLNGADSAGVGGVAALPGQSLTAMGLPPGLIGATIDDDLELEDQLWDLEMQQANIYFDTSWKSRFMQEVGAVVGDNQSGSLNGAAGAGEGSGENHLMDGIDEGGDAHVAGTRGGVSSANASRQQASTAADRLAGGATTSAAAGSLPSSRGVPGATVTSSNGSIPAPEPGGSSLITGVGDVGQLFQPQHDIVPTGWDTLLDESLPTAMSDGTAGGVQFLSFGGQDLDANALLQDIAYDEQSILAMQQRPVQPKLNGFVPVKVPMLDSDDLLGRSFSAGRSQRAPAAGQVSSNPHSDIRSANAALPMHSPGSSVANQTSRLSFNSQFETNNNVSDHNHNGRRRNNDELTPNLIDGASTRTTSHDAANGDQNGKGGGSCGITVGENLPHNVNATGAHPRNPGGHSGEGIRPTNSNHGPADDPEGAAAGDAYADFDDRDKRAPVDVIDWSEFEEFKDDLSLDHDLPFPSSGLLRREESGDVGTDDCGSCEVTSVATIDAVGPQSAKGVKYCDPCVNLVDFIGHRAPVPQVPPLSNSPGPSETTSTTSESNSDPVESNDQRAVIETAVKADWEKHRNDYEDLEVPVLKFEEKDLSSVPFGPSPCLVLQALTMSNASDGFNLERLETVGDSFLKYAITIHLFVAHQDKHEGKLSFLRSKQVSNYNLYKLGKRKGLGEIIVAAKFEPTDNWLPPGFTPLDVRGDNLKVDEIDEQMDMVLEGKLDEEKFMEAIKASEQACWYQEDELGGHIVPYNMLTQQSVPDKSIADAVESLIGVYLLTYGPEGALRFMQWLGLRVLPTEEEIPKHHLKDPLLQFSSDPELQLCRLWRQHNFGRMEQILQYSFQDKAYLIQAFTHASYHYNRITDCYQRLEFLGDAVLDYLITRHLFEDSRKHSPGVLTDLRSALVNNTIFASLGVKYEFHKFFLAICPGLHYVIEKFVKLQNEKKADFNFDEELYLLVPEEDAEDEEDIEVPKAIGDIFESIAGAIYLDSGQSLDVVWKVYFNLMKEQIEKCCRNPPKSPIRELLEMEPENAKFSKAERLVTEGKVRVHVDVGCKGRFSGLGRNYRIAKCTAAKRALKYLKTLQRQRQRASFLY